MKLQELFEGKDPAPAILAAVSKTLRAMGFKKKSGGNTQGVKRAWMIQTPAKMKPRNDDTDSNDYEGESTYDKKVLDSLKYNFMSADSVAKFVKDFQAAGGGKLEDVRYDKKFSLHNGADLDGDGFNIKSQNDDTFGQVVISVARGNKAGDSYRQGYDT